MSSIDPSSGGKIPNIPKPQEPSPRSSFSEHMQGASANNVNSASQGEQAFRNMFPTMHFTKTQYQEFLKNMVRQLSTQMTRDLKEMKKAAQQMKKAIEGQGP